jgi:hypothetical protein
VKERETMHHLIIYQYVYLLLGKKAILIKRIIINASKTIIFCVYFLFY